MIISSVENITYPKNGVNLLASISILGIGNIGRYNTNSNNLSVFFNCCYIRVIHNLDIKPKNRALCKISNKYINK